jgi:hypothetical protein
MIPELRAFGPGRWGDVPELRAMSRGCETFVLVERSGRVNPFGGDVDEVVHYSVDREVHGWGRA